MSEEEAKALAAKREAHKSKHMTNKEWRAVHDSVKGWHVALVDSAQHLLRVQHDARLQARDALIRGDAQAFMDAAHDSLMAAVRRSLATSETAS